jgi:ketosteroid isomerase-like protein
MEFFGMCSPRDRVQAFLEQWADDPEGAMGMVSPDIAYTLNVDPEALQIGGETAGWNAVNAMMLSIRNVFEYLVYRPRISSAAGDIVRARVELILRHRASGELLMTHMRIVVTVRDNMISRVEEYVDAPMVESFLRLFSNAGNDARGGKD